MNIQQTKYDDIINHAFYDPYHLFAIERHRSGLGCTQTLVYHILSRTIRSFPDMFGLEKYMQSVPSLNSRNFFVAAIRGLQ